ncbi:alpha/beta-hydrolase [Rhizodiscina lignyota]|uniref:Carboxylic ester hydrolase n=1 Tax=Rhizodiscina lignyota TaxID=1504668 RepID=A0A9P4IJR4_9PEZI|nr:alpha/beta-hydrolase [Rhizodiscina lignyota]
MLLLLNSLVLLLAHGVAIAIASPSGTGHRVAPKVTVKNGTYTGKHLAEYDQDIFLGVPFAQPPVGDLRFTVPQPLNGSWNGARDATKYSTECVGYGSDQWPYEISEDCLYLNVIRPAGNYKNLPIAFWIHGGGYSMGGGVDQRYNMSFMVQNSVKIGKPIIGVSINYRLATWGFLNSNEVQGTGNTNLGLRDQRLALHWVQENIGAFGGDPSKVTIFGESAGASAVGFHLVAYGGRDDCLFRGAIMESGNPIPYFPLNGVDYYQPLYDLLVNSTGCGNSTDTLQCLRGVPFESLNKNPALDGDFVQQYPSIQLAQGRFVHVPIIDGTNSDEGHSFGPSGINTTQDFANYLESSGVPPSLTQELLKAYPDIPSEGIPGSPPLGSLPPNFRFGPPQGPQFRRSAAYAGDEVFIANRRLTTQTWAAAGVPAYSYRFNVVPAGLQFVDHFQEVSSVFYNLMGVGYEAPGTLPPFHNEPKSHAEVARLMDSSWISFVHDQDPNSFRQTYGQGGFPGMKPWPRYSVQAPQNFVFDANVTSHPEPDTWRAAGIKLINENNVGVYRR